MDKLIIALAAAAFALAAGRSDAQQAAAQRADDERAIG
jgi:hypothetical protein